MTWTTFPKATSPENDEFVKRIKATLAGGSTPTPAPAAVASYTEEVGFEVQLTSKNPLGGPAEKLGYQVEGDSQTLYIRKTLTITGDYDDAVDAEKAKIEAAYKAVGYSEVSIYPN